MNIETLARIHREMLDGTDYQTAAINNDVDDFNFPDPSGYCECGTCQIATQDGEWWYDGFELDEFYN